MSGEIYISIAPVNVTILKRTETRENEGNEILKNNLEGTKLLE